MAEEISEGLELMAKSGELMIRFFGSLIKGADALAGRISGRSGSKTKVDVELEKAAQQKRVREFIGENTKGQVTMEQMADLYGPEHLQYVTVPNEHFKTFTDALNSLHVPYAVAQSHGENGMSMIAFRDAHAPAVTMALEMAQGKILSSDEAAHLKTVLPEKAVMDFDQFVTRTKDEAQRLNFMTIFLDSPEGASKMADALNAKGVPHLVSDEQGARGQGAGPQTCITFSADRAQIVQQTLNEQGARFVRPPEGISCEIYGRELYRHMTHRQQYETQQAQREAPTLTERQGPQLVTHSQLINIAPEQADELQKAFMQANVSAVFDRGAGVADVLITDDQLEKAEACLVRTNIGRGFEPVPEAEVEDIWKGPDQKEDVRNAVVKMDKRALQRSLSKTRGARDNSRGGPDRTPPAGMRVPVTVRQKAQPLKGGDSR